MKNNGIKGKIAEQEFAPNSQHTITATVIGQYKYAKLQLSPYYCSQNINKLTPKFKFNKSVMYFFVIIIQKFIAKYDGQQGGYKLDELENHIAQIPTLKNGELAFKFMEIFIKAVLKEVIKNVVLWSEKNIQAHKDIIESKA
ncbi:restriction endonuclease subunit S [Campylobacter troglodytis]|uniref:restriction endonuclease subunit S n=1 Tax=Campylobacter troglodytis TaxID=654363 RepID=UPI00115ABF89|nr:restriction endonuclease subunit S [Campylobacter troglodytis]TQR61187.1 hypothetical protein DMC01_02655 [Campylobacter troglodytis]